MNDLGRENGIELSERDIDLRTLGVEGLAILEMLTDGSAEEREQELIQQLKLKYKSILENDGKNVVNLPIYIKYKKLGREGFTELLRLNPQYACEYIGALFLTVAQDYLAIRPQNLNDIEFELKNVDKSIAIEDITITLQNPNKLTNLQKESLIVSTMVKSAIEYLIESKLVSDIEIKDFKNKIQNN